MIDFMDGSFVWIDDSGAHTIDIDEALEGGLVYAPISNRFLLSAQMKDLTEHARLMYEMLK